MLISILAYPNGLTQIDLKVVAVIDCIFKGKFERNYFSKQTFTQLLILLN